MNNIRGYYVLIIFPFIFGCASFTQIHNYAALSVESLHKIDTLDYTFSDYCYRRCEMDQMRVGIINPNYSCECQAGAANADSAIKKIHYTITTYLYAVAQLSNNRNFTYNASPLTGAIQHTTLLNLTDHQVSIATKAANFIATASTSYYRKKKLMQYLTSADSIFQELTSTFIYLVDTRLRTQLKLDYEAHLANLNQMADNSTDAGFKQFVVKLYLDEKAFYNKHNDLIDTYSLLLKSVQKGYHELYIHRHNLADVSTREIMGLYYKDLVYIAASIK